MDGKTLSFTKDPLAELNFILPEEAERTEFLDCGRGCVVVSIYTRDCMRDLLARQAELPNCTVIPALVYGLSAQFDPDPQPQIIC